MPWYEPVVWAPSPPRCPPNVKFFEDGEDEGDRSTEKVEHKLDPVECNLPLDIVDVDPFSDDTWQRPQRIPSQRRSHLHDNHPANQNIIPGTDIEFIYGPREFDGIQIGVEIAMQRSFPTVAFAATKRYPLAPEQLRPSSDPGIITRWNFGGNNQQGNSGTSRWDAIFGRRDRDKPPICKSAQFFHPRPVMALQPYRNFFSPIRFPTCNDQNETNDDVEDDSRNKAVAHGERVTQSANNYGVNGNGIATSQENNSRHSGTSFDASHRRPEQGMMDRNGPREIINLEEMPDDGLGFGFHGHPNTHSTHYYDDFNKNGRQPFQHRSLQNSHAAHTHSNHYQHEQCVEGNRDQRELFNVTDDGNGFSSQGKPNDRSIREKNDEYRVSSQTMDSHNSFAAFAAPSQHHQEQDMWEKPKSHPRERKSNGNQDTYTPPPKKRSEKTYETHIQRPLQSNGRRKSPRQTTPIQAKITQDSKTGKLLTQSAVKLDQFAAVSATKTKKSWDCYTGWTNEGVATKSPRAALAEATNRDGGPKQGKRSKDTSKTGKSQKEDNDGKKKGKKDKKSKKKRSNPGENDIDSFLKNVADRSKATKKSRATGDDTQDADISTQHDNDRHDTASKDRERKRKSSEAAHRGDKRSKKQKSRSISNSFSELYVPDPGTCNAMSQPNDVNANGRVPSISEEDFAGIEEMNFQNAGACANGLESFLHHARKQKHVAWTMVFVDPYTGNYTNPAAGNAKDGSGKARKKFANLGLDSRGFECTTPFLPTSTKYCTEKGPRCRAWNCVCDDQIRAKRGSAVVLGAMFVFVEELNGDTFYNVNCGQQEDSNQRKDHSPGNRTTHCYLLPLSPTKGSHDVPPHMENWPVLPFECDVSLVDRWKALESLLLDPCPNGTKLVTYNATVSLLPFFHYKTLAPHSHDDPFHRSGGILRSNWDLRLASWMLRCDASDSDLEFSTFKEGFSHLVPAHSIPSREDFPMVTGLIKAKADLEFLHVLYPIIKSQISERGLSMSLDEIEAPVQSILSAMEVRGVGFYPHRLQNIETKLNSRIDELEAQARKITNDNNFLLSSPQQVSHFLFDVAKLSIPAGLVSKTVSGSSHRSTSEEALKAIKSVMMSKNGSYPPFIDILLEFRNLNKLLTTYIRPLPRFCCREKQFGGRKSKKVLAKIHPMWMMTATRTGRLSCRKPNLQQVPTEGAFGLNPRHAFVPSLSKNINGGEGMCLFACDYSQKEVRILAHMSNDVALISLFKSGENIDIYKQMSSLIRNKPVEQVTPQERAIFKQVTLALLYGMSANQVAKKLSISKTTAQQMMGDFFRRFRGVKSWMDETKAFARKNHYVQTIAGRRRYLDGIESEDEGKRNQAERQAVNTVIQGSAADLMKRAMLNMAKNLAAWQHSETSFRPQMILQIHDELLFEVLFNELDIKRLHNIALRSCCHDLESDFGLKVPLLLKCSCGLSWGSMKEM